VRREVVLWLKSAEDDIFDAKLSLNNKRYFRTAFFAQQAVEKSLKALFFVVKKDEPPKLHTVTELYRELKKGGFTLPEEVEEQLYILNKYYTVSRYPDAANGLPSESVDKIEAERALKIAEVVLGHAKKHAGYKEEG
jgi:HEPN domain-containing protein